MVNKEELKVVELKDMTKEELLGVIEIKDYRIKELEQEVEVLREILNTKLTKKDFEK